MGSVAGAMYLSVWSDGTYDDAIYDATNELADAGLIDSVENMNNDKLYIFQGILDSITPFGEKSCKIKIWISKIPFRSRRKNQVILWTVLSRKQWCYTEKWYWIWTWICKFSENVTSIKDNNSSHQMSKEDYVKS